MATASAAPPQRPRPAAPAPFPFPGWVLLSPDMTLRILSALGPQHFGTCRSVCRRWRQLLLASRRVRLRYDGAEASRRALEWAAGCPELRSRWSLLATVKPLSEDATFALAACVRRSPSIGAVELEGALPMDEGRGPATGELLRALGASPTLTELQLHRNALGAEATAVLATALASGPRGALRALDYSQNDPLGLDGDTAPLEALCPALAGKTGLRSIHLGSCGLGPGCAGLLTTLLTGAHGLRELSLPSNQLFEAGGLALAGAIDRGCCGALRVLDLRRTALGQTALLALASAAVGARLCPRLVLGHAPARFADPLAWRCRPPATPNSPPRRPARHSSVCGGARPIAPASPVAASAGTETLRAGAERTRCSLSGLPRGRRRSREGRSATGRSIFGLVASTSAGAPTVATGAWGQRVPEHRTA